MLLLRLLILGMICSIVIGCASGSTVYETPEQYQISSEGGTIYDSTTGLTWRRCVLGQQWNGVECEGTPQGYKWDAALAAAEQWCEGDECDWRLPSLEELHTLTYCPPNQSRGPKPLTMEEADHLCKMILLNAAFHSPVADVSPILSLLIFFPFLLTAELMGVSTDLPTDVIPPDVFPGVASEPGLYWSSTLHNDYRGVAWYIDYAKESTGYLSVQVSDGQVLLVRRPIVE